MARPPVRSAPERAPARVSAFALEKVVGTTTFAKSEMNELVTRLGVDGDIVYTLTGYLRREPNNPTDPQAIAVHYDGDRIGYLAHYVAKALALEVGEERHVPLRIVGAVFPLPKGLRCHAYVWLADSPPVWPPIEQDQRIESVADRAAAAHKRNVETVKNHPSHGSELEGGRVSGIAVGILSIEPIKQLKREGRYEDALKLCYASIQGAEDDQVSWQQEFGVANAVPAPAYTMQAAMCHRKLKQYAAEVSVIERWLARCTPESASQNATGRKLIARLERARELAQKQLGNGKG